MKMKWILIWLFIVIAGLAGAQPPITLEEALDKALKNNFNIQVARNDAQIQKINNTAGYAGMLPSVSAVGSGNYEVNNVDQELASGDKTHYSASSTTALNAGVELSWTLFDGGRMFLAKSRLNEYQALGDIAFKQQVLALMYNVVGAYYNVVKLKQQLISLESVQGYNTERVKITQTAFENGLQVKSNWIQAKIDLNVTRESIINQQFAIVSAKKELNLILGQATDIPVEVIDTIELNYSPDKNLLVQTIDSTNPSVMFYKKQTDIARLSLKSNNRLYLPSLQFKAGYYLSHIENSDGSMLKNRSLGPQFGGSLVIPLYQAGETRRKVMLSQLNLQSAELELEQARLEVNTDLQNAFTDFENQQQLLKIEEENNQLTRENLEICLQRLRLGQANSLEVHLAEESFAQSSTRLIQFRYNLKMSETRIKQLVAGM